MFHTGVQIKHIWCQGWNRIEQELCEARLVVWQRMGIQLPSDWSDCSHCFSCMKAFLSLGSGIGLVFSFPTIVLCFAFWLRICNNTFDCRRFCSLLSLYFKEFSLRISVLLCYLSMLGMSSIMLCVLRGKKETNYSTKWKFNYGKENATPTIRTSCIILYIINTYKQWYYCSDFLLSAKTVVH